MRARLLLAAVVLAGLVAGCGTVTCTPGTVCVVQPAPTVPAPKVTVKPDVKERSKTRERHTRSAPPPGGVAPKARRTVAFYVRRGDNSLLLVTMNPGFVRGRITYTVDTRVWSHIEYGVPVGSIVSVQAMGGAHVQGTCWITVNGKEGPGPRDTFHDGQCDAAVTVA